MRFGSELTIHLDHLAYNVQQLKVIAPKNEVIFMVKANAYGHGMGEIVSFSHQELGLTRFGVASLGEAIWLRKQYPKLFVDLWVFSDTDDFSNSTIKEMYLDYNIVPVLHQLSDLKKILEDKDYQKMPLVLKFDTGMHRLGLELTDLNEVLDLLKRHDRTEVKHIMTHFAQSYIQLKPEDKTHRQYADFLKIKSEFKHAGIDILETSCANSGAIEQNFSLEETHIRPGLMLYGPASVSRQLWPSKNVSTLKSRVLKIIEVKRGTPIGYGGHVVAQDGFIAYLPLGYGDGFLTFASGVKLKFWDNDAHIIGRVNMDITGVFFKEKPSQLKVGSELILWGEGENDVTHISEQMKTIPYQLFTAVNSRVPRRYIN